MQPIPYRISQFENFCWVSCVLLLDSRSDYALRSHIFIPLIILVTYQPTHINLFITSMSLLGSWSILLSNLLPHLCLLINYNRTSSYFSDLSQFLWDHMDMLHFPFGSFPYFAIWQHSLCYYYTAIHPGNKAAKSENWRRLLIVHIVEQKCSIWDQLQSLKCCLVHDSADGHWNAHISISLRTARFEKSSYRSARWWYCYTARKRKTQNTTSRHITRGTLTFKRICILLFNCLMASQLIKWVLFFHESDGERLKTTVKGN